MLNQRNVGVSGLRVADLSCSPLRACSNDFFNTHSMLHSSHFPLTLLRFLLRSHALIATLEFHLTTVDEGNQRLLPYAFPGLKCHRNVLAAGTPPRTMLGELTVLPQNL